MNKSFHIRTYGCQMNARDSEALACLLEANGFRRAPDEDSADILLFNTCCVRAQAEHKVLGKVGLLKRRKLANPELLIGILGCMAQNRGETLFEKLPHLDVVVGTDHLHELPELLIQALEPEHRGSHTVTTETCDGVLGALTRHVPGQVSASISVMRGCDEFCTYCIVPYVRGREKSRRIAEIVREVETVVDQGSREIFLLGQNVTAYGLAEARRERDFSPEISPFADLLRAVHEVPGVARIRFTSPHPKYMNEAFVAAITELPKVCQAFHVPLQSGSDRVLGLMRRGYTAEQYRGIIGHIRERSPRAAFSTDIIVGFPSEDERDFQATCDLMNEVAFDMAYIFKYSTRTGTLAARKFSDNVPQSVKEERNQILLADLQERIAATNRALIGRQLEVLVEGPGTRNPSRWGGRTESGKACHFEPTGHVHAGDLIMVRVTDCTAHALYGTC